MGKFIAETRIRVRYAETDTMGLVHHSNYVVYFEEARSHYSRERGNSYASFEETGYYLIVSEVQIKYLAPARYDEELVVKCWIEEMKSRRMVFAYEVVNAAGKVIATGKTQHICITKAGQVARIPDEWRVWEK